MLQYLGVVGVIDYKNLHFRVMSFFFIRISMLLIGCHFYGAFGKHMPVTSRGCRWRTTWVLCEVFKKLKREKTASKAEWRRGKILNPMGQWRPVPRVFLWKTQVLGDLSKVKRVPKFRDKRTLIGMASWARFFLTLIKSWSNAACRPMYNPHTTQQNDDGCSRLYNDDAILDCCDMLPWHRDNFKISSGPNTADTWSICFVWGENSVGISSDSGKLEASRVPWPQPEASSLDLKSEAEVFRCTVPSVGVRVECVRNTSR